MEKGSYDLWNLMGFKQKEKTNGQSMKIEYVFNNYFVLYIIQLNHIQDVKDENN